MDLLDQMATFVDIVEAGSLSAAARRRRLSLAAVSRQLAALERELGAALALRTTRALALTEAGRVFHAHAIRTLSEVKAARANVRGALAATGTVRVSAAFTVGLELLVDVLPSLTAAHPGLQVALRLEDHASDLVRDGIDVAIRAGLAPADSVSIVARELLQFSRWVVAAPRYLRARGTPTRPSALATHDALLQLTDVGALDTWSLGDESVRVRGRLHITSPSALRELALAGHGLALLPEWLVAEDVATGRLRRVLASAPTPRVAVWALHRTELRDVPRVRTFVDHVARSLAARNGA